jgi:DNA polymerase-3 subunit delta
MTEDQLRNELKQGVFRRVYLLHGRETFLVQHYTAQIRDRALGGADEVLNLAKFVGNKLDSLAESLETLPVFADRKVILLNDLDVEKLKAEELEPLLNLIEKITDMSCVIIHMTGIALDLKKAKTKKLIAAIETHKKKAAVIELERIADINKAIDSRTRQLGCVISRENASCLAQLCLRNYTLIRCEIEKLCAHANYSGEITRNAIDTLVARQLDSKVFALAGEIAEGRGASALKLLDELLSQGENPMPALQMTFLDFYRAKLGAGIGKIAPQVAKDFGYPPNRAFAVGKAMSAVNRIPLGQLRGCIQVLCDADYKLKSSPIDNRIIMERAVARLLMLC